MAAGKNDEKREYCNCATVKGKNLLTVLKTFICFKNVVKDVQTLA